LLLSVHVLIEYTGVDVGDYFRYVVSVKGIIVGVVLSGMIELYIWPCLLRSVFR